MIELLAAWAFASSDDGFEAAGVPDSWSCNKQIIIVLC